MRMARLNPLNLIFIFLLFSLTACGGGGGGSGSSKATIKEASLTVNSKSLAGISFRSGATTGITDSSGAYRYEEGRDVTFSLDSEILGKLSSKEIANTSPTTLTQIVNSGENPSSIIKDLPNLYKQLDTGGEYIQSPTFLSLIGAKKEKILTLKGKPVKGVLYSSGDISGTTDQYGLFDYQASTNIDFTVAGKLIGSINPSNLPVSIEHLVKNAENPILKHLPMLLEDLNPESASIINAQVSEYRLEQALFKPDSLPLDRSLGINLETPQAEADGIYQPLPFVDIFRVARPFQEGSCDDISYDRAGWPLELPASCASQGNKKYAKTRILQFMPAGAAAAGRYHVFYDGKGIITFSGMASNKQAVGTGHLTVDIKPLSKTQSIHGVEVFLTKIDATDPIRNIRIVMPGGICKGNPFDRVESSSQCSDDKPFIAFSDVLKNNRDAIIFNPDYLAFHKDFRVLRMMNIMEATPRRPESNSINPCLAETNASTNSKITLADLTADASSSADSIAVAETAVKDAKTAYNSCLTRPRNWNHIAKISDASWGGSFKTIVTKRYGVPLEVTVALANLLQSHPWYTLPFNADNDYIDKYASYLKGNLDPSLKAHIEYTNEFWNGGFWGSQYALVMGYQLGLNSPKLDFKNEDHTARVRFYSKRSVEIFKRFESVFGGTARLVRIMGSSHKSHSISREILDHNDASDDTDVLAVAPYFHGCWSRSRKIGDEDISIVQCSDTDVVPTVFTEATSLDDVFAIMNTTYTPTESDIAKKGDTDSVSSITQLISNQVTIANQFGVDLYAYEGGQHLKVNFGDPEISQAKKDSLQDLFTAANKDPRMGELYIKLLSEWKQRGGKQFMLFTSPQSFNRFGFFGIKEHINQARSDAPKYDAAMRFQEDTAGCWWVGCK